MGTEPNNHSTGNGEVCPIFLCYRRVDGLLTAEWLYQHLDHQQRDGHAQQRLGPESLKLAIYFDQTAPVVPDWQAVHGTALRRSRAMILVSTPGAANRLGDDDWVHNEIDWWLKNRNSAPIIIDATGEGQRWIPRAVSQRWPDAQRLELRIEECKRLNSDEQIVFEERILGRILRGIALSERQVVDENLAREQRTSRRLKLAVTGMIGVLVVASALGGLAYWEYLETDLAKAVVQKQATTLLKAQTELRDALISATGNAKKAQAQRALAEKESKRAARG
jgi:hypothetical protein